MLKYSFNEYMDQKELTRIIEDSVPTLENLGIDPKDFYEYILANPQILTEEEQLNELLRNIKSWGAGIGNVIKNRFGDWGNSSKQADLDHLRALQKNDPAAFAKTGIQQSDLDNLDKDIKTRSTNRNMAWGDSFRMGTNDKWHQINQQDQEARTQQAKGRFDASNQSAQVRFGRGPYAPISASTPPTPLLPPAGTLGAVRGSGSYIPRSPPPATPRSASPGGIDVKNLTNKLGQIIKMKDNNQMRIALKTFFNSLSTPTA